MINWIYLCQGGRENEKTTAVSTKRNAKSYAGRRLLYSFILFCKCVYDALVELDRRTDITEKLIAYVQLNNVDDDYDDDDVEYAGKSHFGVVRLAIMFAVLPLVGNCLGFIMALLQ